MTWCRGPHRRASTEPLCSRCRSRLRRSLANLPEQFLLLHVALTPERRGRAERTGTGSAPIPVDVEVEAVMREAVQVLVAWEEVIAHQARLSDPVPTSNELTLVHRASRLLLIHAEQLLVSPMAPQWRWGETGLQVRDLDGIDGANEIIAVAAAATRLLGTTVAQTQRLRGVICPECGCASLSRREDMIECGACDRAWKDEDYHRLVGELAASIRRGA